MMMNYGRGFLGNNGCFEYGFFSNGWNWLIGIGVVLIIVAVVFLIATRNKRALSDYSALETLKVKFSQGEITEEEYKKRKSVLQDR